jgi:hypothetical protein
MKNILQANLNAGLSLSIPSVHLNSAWRPFQASIVRSFVRRQRREALRARLIERAFAVGNGDNE